MNGVAIRNDTFQRYQKFQTYLLNNQLAQLQGQLTKLQSDTKHAAANAPVIQALQQQFTQLQGNASNIQAYTLSQMESALELDAGRREDRRRAHTGAARHPDGHAARSRPVAQPSSRRCSMPPA